MRVVTVGSLCCLILRIEGRHFFEENNGIPFDQLPHIDEITLNYSYPLVDHSPIEYNNATWPMRYYSYSGYYKPGGPIFIEIGGEGSISPAKLISTLTAEMAYMHNGYLVHPEHRYYGESYPDKTFKYLLIYQVLEDLAYFIDHLKHTIPGATNSKVVVAGCSYAGTLATWARRRFPDLVDAAFAGSAPLKATEAFPEYMEAVGQAIYNVDRGCFNMIKEATSMLEKKLQDSSTKFDTYEKFGVYNLVSDSDFYFNITMTWIAGFQYFDKSQIQQRCKNFSIYHGSPFEKMAAYTKDNIYLSTYETSISHLHRVTRKSEMNATSWLYQCCRELGWIPDENMNEPFPIFGPFRSDECIRAHEINQSTHLEGIKNINWLYGSTTPNVTKVVTAHGALDPWRTLGIQSSLNNEAPVIVTPDVGHCHIYHRSNMQDTDVVKNDKNRIKQYISKWIQ